MEILCEQRNLKVIAKCTKTGILKTGHMSENWTQLLFAWKHLNINSYEMEMMEMTLTHLAKDKK